MLAIIGGSVALIIFFFFLDLKLTAITLAPVLFALISTLGTFHLIGHPLDIPALMLGIIVMGMGIDYSLYLVCAYQRYGGMDTPDFARIKMAVTMAAGSTLIGFGVLCLAEHALLYSAGVTSSLGIGFSLIGAFGLLPPLLEHHFRRPSSKAEHSLDLHQRILNRYRHLTVHPRLFARIKLKKDVLFAELPLFLERDRSLATVLDIGCGYGVPGCWILETHPETRIHAIEPDPERVRVAGLAFDGRGEVVCDLAPNIPAAPQPADAALLLDMIHFLDEESLRTTLTRLHAALSPGALLVIRTVVPAPDGRRSLHWRIDALRMRLAGFRAYHRPADKVAAIVATTGFRITKQAGSGNNPELTWITATRRSV
jgi:SAM-dependent methyltransferase